MNEQPMALQVDNPDLRYAGERVSCKLVELVESLGGSLLRRRCERGVQGLE